MDGIDKQLKVLATALSEGRPLATFDLDLLAEASSSDVIRREFIDVFVAALCRIAGTSHSAAMIGHQEAMLGALLRIEALSTALVSSIKAPPSSDCDPQL